MWACPEVRLARRIVARHDGGVEESPIGFGDVTTIMRLMGNIEANVVRIRKLMEEALGEEEEDPEDDA